MFAGRKGSPQNLRLGFRVGATIDTPHMYKKDRDWDFRVEVE
jgi:hypothetical protein